MFSLPFSKLIEIKYIYNIYCIMASVDLKGECCSSTWNILSQYYNYVGKWKEFFRLWKLRRRSRKLSLNSWRIDLYAPRAAQNLRLTVHFCAVNFFFRFVYLIEKWSFAGFFSIILLQSLAEFTGVLNVNDYTSIIHNTCIHIYCRTRRDSASIES